MHDANAELDRLRAAVDVCNRRLCAVLQERAALAAAIGRCKAAHGLPALDPAREAAMLAAIGAGRPGAAEAGPLDDDALRRILTAVLVETRALVQRGR